MAASLKLLTHPKVPLTPSESRQLLNIITTSFRLQLDKEHGTDPSGPPEAVSSTTQATASSDLLRGTKQSLSRSNTPSTTPTERHLHGILTNPLFALPNRQPAAVKDPMQVFDEACAKGLMTNVRARACLLAKKRELRKLPTDLSASVQMSESGVKVFRWLLSTGAADNSSWLLPYDASYPRNQKKSKPDIIFEFLVLEGKQELLWDLFEHHISQRKGRADLLLYHLSNALAHSASVDTAYRSLIRANEILQRQGISKKCGANVLAKAVRSLVKTTLVTGSPQPQQNAELFDVFLGIVEAALPRSALSLSHLQLYHPTKPDAKPALQHLKNLDETSSDEINSAHDVSARAEDTKLLVWLALDTAKLLLKQEQYEDARWVMDFLQTRHPEQIGAERHAEAKLRVEQAEAEATNLQLLNNLELGLGAT